MRYAINRNKFLSEDEQSDIARELNTPGATTIEERDKLLFLLLLNTGARAKELLNCTTKDLNLAEGVLLLRGLKGSNDREIPLPTGLLERLKAYVSGASGGRLFPITYWRLRQIWDEWKMPKTPHSTRHTFAINLYKRTRDLRLVQVALGHRSIQNTIVYADYIFQTDELRKGILG